MYASGFLSNSVFPVCIGLEQVMVKFLVSEGLVSLISGPPLQAEVCSDALCEHFPAYVL